MQDEHLIFLSVFDFEKSCILSVDRVCCTQFSIENKQACGRFKLLITLRIVDRREAKPLPGATLLSRGPDQFVASGEIDQNHNRSLQVIGRQKNLWLIQILSVVSSLSGTASSLTPG